MTRPQLTKRLGINHETLSRFERRKQRVTAYLLRLLLAWLSLPDDQARRARPKYSDGWPEDSVSFGQQLRQCREAAGLNIQAVALLSGLRWATVRDLETGAIRNPLPATRRRVISALSGIRRLL